MVARLGRDGCSQGLDFNESLHSLVADQSSEPWWAGVRGRIIPGSTPLWLVARLTQAPALCGISRPTSPDTCPPESDPESDTLPGTLNTGGPIAASHY